MTAYRHYRPGTVITPLIAVTLIGVLVVGALAWAALNPNYSGPPPLFLAAVLVILGVNAWLLGGVAIEARVSDDGILELSGPLKSARIAVRDIISIVPSRVSQSAVYVVKHRGGAIRVEGRLNGMHELISELKRQNPAITLVGI